MRAYLAQLIRKPILLGFGMLFCGFAVPAAVFNMGRTLYVLLVGSLALFCLHGLHVLFLADRKWVIEELKLAGVVAVSVVIQAALYNMFFREARQGPHFVIAETVVNACMNEDT